MALPEPRTAAGAAGLAAVIADPARALVATDYDGTLAPIVPRPQDARPAAGAVAALADLAAVVGTVAVVTGRRVVDVLALADLHRSAGLGRLQIVGQHGLERWSATDGEVRAPAPLPAVARLRAELPGMLASHGLAGLAVEDKGHALVVHTRRTADPDGTLARAAGPLAELAARHGLLAVPGRMLVELRPPGVDKGGALSELVAERDARAVLFAGDDLGDLPAFAAVERLRAAGVPGVTVCSGSAEAAEVAERADLVVAGPDGLVALLRALAAAIGSGG